MEESSWCFCGSKLEAALVELRPVGAVKRSLPKSLVVSIIDAPLSSALHARHLELMGHFDTPLAPLGPPSGSPKPGLGARIGLLAVPVNALSRLKRRLPGTHVTPAAQTHLKDTASIRCESIAFTIRTPLPLLRDQAAFSSRQSSHSVPTRIPKSSTVRCLQLAYPELTSWPLCDCNVPRCPLYRNGATIDGHSNSIQVIHLD